MSATQDIIRHAETYLRERIEVFRKDMRICLKADSNRRHAYMPALLTCTSLLDLLACLYAGGLRPKGQKHILKYAQDFMDQRAYPRVSIALLWQMFRHKVAHATQPYGVYDSHSGDKKNNPLRGQRRMWVTWKICASNRSRPIEVIERHGILEERPPWPTPYTHRCTISLYRLKVDVPASVLKHTGYLACLKADSKARAHFRDCMQTIFPRDAICQQT